MNLTETGESRVNGYLFVLGRSLKTFLPSDAVRDAVREIESHLRERVASADGAPNEREVIERILAALGLLICYLISFAFMALAVLKPIFPDNVGVVYKHGIPVGLGAHFPLTPGTELRGGYWVIPFALFCGLGIFVGTHRGARHFLSRWRERRLS